MPRVFVGLVPDAATIDALRSLRAAAEALPLRWSLDVNLHVTLRFLGEITAPALEALSRDLARAPLPTLPPLDAVGLGAFPHLDAAKTLYACVVPERPVIQLAQAIEAFCRMAGAPPETHARIPHVTLARTKGQASLRSLVEATGPTRWGPIAIGAMHVFVSHLSPGGSRYERVADIELPP